MCPCGCKNPLFIRSTLYLSATDRQSSYHDVVYVFEVEDSTGVQVYIINSSKVLFLHERLHERWRRPPLQLRAL